MSWAFCTSGSAIAKAGKNANATIIASGSTLANWYDEAEALVCDTARVNLSGANLTHPGKQIISMIISAKIAQNIVAYDTTSYVLSREAETILDKLEDEVSKGLKLIEDQKVKTYMNII